MILGGWVLELSRKALRLGKGSLRGGINGIGRIVKRGGVVVSISGDSGDGSGKWVGGGSVC